MSTDPKSQFAPRRYLSRLTRGTLAVIMAGGRGERLKHLTDDRCKPATPFGGKFRIIDFVAVELPELRHPADLRADPVQGAFADPAHLQRGWGYLRGEFGEFIEIVPAQQQLGQTGTGARPTRCTRTWTSSDRIGRGTCWCSQATTSTRWTTVR